MFNYRKSISLFVLSLVTGMATNAAAFDVDVMTNGDCMKWTLFDQIKQVFVGQDCEGFDNNWITGSCELKSLDAGIYQMQYGGQQIYLLRLDESGNFTYRGTPPEVDSLQIEKNPQEINWDVKDVRFVIPDGFKTDWNLESFNFGPENPKESDVCPAKAQKPSRRTMIPLMKGPRFLITASQDVDGVPVTGAGLFRITDNLRLRKILIVPRDASTGELNRIVETEDAFFAGQKRRKHGDIRVHLNRSFWKNPNDKD